MYINLNTTCPKRNKEAVYLEFFAVFHYLCLFHDFSWNPYGCSAEPWLGNPDVYSQGVRGAS